MRSGAAARTQLMPASTLSPTAPTCKHLPRQLSTRACHKFYEIKSTVSIKSRVQSRFHIEFLSRLKHWTEPTHEYLQSADFELFSTTPGSRRCSRKQSRYKGTLVTAGRKKHDVAPDDGQRRHVNLDRFQVLDLARNAPDAFFKQYPLPALIDEFQRAPNLVRTKLARSSY